MKLRWVHIGHTEDWSLWNAYDDSGDVVGQVERAGRKWVVNRHKDYPKATRLEPVRSRREGMALVEEDTRRRSA